MTDERYKSRAAKHKTTLARCSEFLGGADTERLLKLTKEIFATVTNIGDIFEMVNGEEGRRLMML